MILFPDIGTTKSVISIPIIEACGETYRFQYSGMYVECGEVSIVLCKLDVRGFLFVSIFRLSRENIQDFLPDISQKNKIIK